MFISNQITLRRKCIFSNMLERRMSKTSSRKVGLSLLTISTAYGGGVLVVIKSLGSDKRGRAYVAWHRCPWCYQII